MTILLIVHPAPITLNGVADHGSCGHNVTRTILGEVGESATPASMAAVASVIRNRLAAGGYGKTPTDIVRAPNQFEPWNPGSGNDPSSLLKNSGFG
jgi:Cell Wall Hydrolase